MNPLRVFLVGATGGLGGHVLRGLITIPHVHVVAYVRDSSKLRDIDTSKVTVVEGDVNQVPHDALKACDLIIAAHSSNTRERYKGYQELVNVAHQAGVQRMIGVGGAGQLTLPNGEIKQTEEGWFPSLSSVTADHQRGLESVRTSGLSWTWVAPAYMPSDAVSSGGYIASNDRWNDGGMIPQVDVARFIIDEALHPKHAGHVVGLKAKPSS